MSSELLEGSEAALTDAAESHSRSGSMRGVVRTRKKVGSDIFVPPVNISGAPENQTVTEEWRKSQERIKYFLQNTVEILDRCYHLLTLAYHPEKEKLSIYRAIQFITERPTYFVRDYFAPLLDSCHAQDNNVTQLTDLLELIFSSMRDKVELKRPACDPKNSSFILDAKINPRLFGSKGVGNLSEELTVREFLSQSDQQFRKRSRLDASCNLQGTDRDKFDDASNNFLILFEVLHVEIRRARQIDSARHESKMQKSNSSIKQTLACETTNLVANLEMKFEDSKAYDYYFRDSASKAIYPLLSVIFRVFIPTFSMVEVMVSSLRTTKHFSHHLVLQKLVLIDKKIAQIAEWIRKDDVYVNSRELYSKTQILNAESIETDFFSLYVENNKFTLETNGDVQLNLMLNVLMDKDKLEHETEISAREDLIKLYASHSETICEAYRDCLDTFIWLGKIIGNDEKGYIIQFSELLEESRQLEMSEVKAPPEACQEALNTQVIAAKDMDKALLDLMSVNTRKSASAIPSEHKGKLGEPLKRSTSGSLASTPSFFADADKPPSNVLPRRKFRPSSGSVSLSPRQSPRSHNSPRTDTSPRSLIPTPNDSPRATPSPVPDPDFVAEGTQTKNDNAKK